MALQSLTTAAAIAITLSCVDPAPAQTPAELYTKAKLVETQDGDVKNALATYERVATHTDAAPSIRVKALYRKALCHIKLEQMRLARETFARIEKRFPRSDEALQAKLMRASLAPTPAAPTTRDLTFEVQQLLVKGTESAKAAQSALRSLHFLGGSAATVLRRALSHTDRGVQLIAAHALASRGDGEVVDALLARAGDRYFNSRKSPIYLTFSDALERLCKHRPDLWPQVRAAYEAASGRAKAQLLGFLAGNGRFADIEGYHDLLTADDVSLRRAAWEAYSHETAQVNDAQYVTRLLDVWGAHPKWHGTLARSLRYARDEARRAGDAIYARWLATTCAAAQSGDENVAETMVLQPCPIEVVGALARSGFVNVRRQATSLARQIKPAGLGDSKSSVEPATATEHAALAATFLDVVLERLEQDESEANQHLHAVAHLAGILPPKEYHVLRAKVASPAVLGRLLRVRRSQLQANMRQALFGFFGGMRVASTTSAGFPFVEKYLPGLIELTALDRWPVLQRHGLEELARFTKESWSEVSSDVRDAVRNAVIALPRLKDKNAERSRYGLIKQLVEATPPAFTAEELLTNLGGRGPSKGSLVRLLTGKGGQLANRYSKDELIAAVRGNLKNPDVRLSDAYSMAVAAGLDASARGALLREMWSQPIGRNRANVIERMAPSATNLAFLQEHYDETWTDEDRGTFIHWLASVRGAARVKPLLLLIDDVDDDQKVEICGQLRSLADRSAVPKLIELLVYRNSTVRKMAEQALESIRAIQSKQDEWREWYEKYGRGPKPAEEKRREQ